MSNISKPVKIFISAHPSDRSWYLEPLVNTIESIEGFVAVYNPIPRDKGPTIPNDTDVLVVIASLKYFIWANSGYESEFSAAVKAGIKIIPLLIESGQNFINLVNTRCKKTQYIDATENLGFALDTLRAHLTSCDRTVDEGLPSAFISYRKCDRKFLHDLVAALEASDSFKNINIWYDEIIAPGENYSKSIMNHLETCNLFILLVTPNILEENNYVLRVEYPAAKKLNKRILAIEAEKTDRQKLKELYGNLGHIIDLKHSSKAIENIKI